MTWPGCEWGYVEVESGELVAGVVDGHAEVVQVFVDELDIVDLLLVLVLALLFLHCKL